MTTNYHTAWQDDVTTYRATDMNAPLSALDSKISSMDKKEYMLAANYVNDEPGASALLCRLVIAKYMVLKSGAPGSLCDVGTAPTAEAVLTMKKNGNSIGTITISGSATTGSFSVSGDKRFYAGDVLTIEAPASPDATLKNISVTLKLVGPASYETTTSTTTA